MDANTGLHREDTSQQRSGNKPLCNSQFLLLYQLLEKFHSESSEDSAFVHWGFFENMPFISRHNRKIIISMSGQMTPKILGHQQVSFNPLEKYKKWNLPF